MGKRIGVLALQGSVEEHLAALARLDGVAPVPVRTARDLKRLDGLILPGGESTTISLLLRIFEMAEPLTRRIASGMPVWGTCAGMILLAKEIDGEPPHYPFMDMRVRRNAYGRQLGSFHATLSIPGLSADPVACVFIRAPWVEEAGPDVEVLAQVPVGPGAAAGATDRAADRIVAVRQGSVLATSFHPEVGDDLRLHRLFLDLVTT